MPQTTNKRRDCYEGSWKYTYVHKESSEKQDLSHPPQRNNGEVPAHSCIQMVPRDLHLLFNAEFDKPLLPATRAAKFGALLLSVARYLPAEAINVSNCEYSRRELTVSERQLIWTNNELRPEQGPKVQKEILSYVTGRDIKGVNEDLVEEFLTTPYDVCEDRKGRELFRIAAEVAVEPIEQEYVDAWQGGLLPRHDIRPSNGKVIDIMQARAVPKSPMRFIARHLIKDQHALRRSLECFMTI